MRDVEGHIASWKAFDPEFAEEFEEGYKEFEFGVLLRQARADAGLTQEQLARMMHTDTSAISRMENRTGDTRLSTLIKAARALGKELVLSLR